MLEDNMFGWEGALFIVASGLCGFAAGLKKMKSNCCCIKLELERDTTGQPAAVTFRRKSKVPRTVGVL